LHAQHQALAVAVEFGGVHALDFGDAGLTRRIRGGMDISTAAR
jgi:hypothetical protein